jgi:hypothetical protein
MFGLIRSVLWFENGEIAEIRAKLTTRKWKYEARWEAEVLFSIFAGAALAFWVNGWLGMFFLWLSKNAVQALNRKKFFDAMP